MDSISDFFFTSEGMRFHVRPVKASDKELFQHGFSQLSKRSKYLRFFTIHSELSDYQLNYFTEVDGVTHVAWGILDETGDSPKPAGVARFVKFKDEPETAEVGIIIIDAYQRKGLGHVLLSVLNMAAAQVGIQKLRYYVLRENRFFLDFLTHLGFTKWETEDDLIVVDTKVYAHHHQIPEGPDLHGFKETMKKTAAYMRRDETDKQ